MSERLAFIQRSIHRGESILDVCAEFGISEKIGHKWLARFAVEGPAGLADRSHARHGQAHQVAPAVAARIIALRKRHPLYGPVMLRDWLRQHEPSVQWPAASTIGELLKRAGLVRSARRRGGTHARLESGRTAATAPNVVWTADFKGEFPLRGGGPKCYPLTVLDLQSHFLLGCTALRSTAVQTARQSFERVFRAYGLPEVIRTDNGIPFAQPNAIGRLGSLAFWWVRLGIRPEHIPPGRPAANGAHERFHKTLKAHTIRPGTLSLQAQQRRFDRFRREYNDERPHTSVAGHNPPSTSYQASPRSYPRRLPPMFYPEAAVVRRVTTAGAIKVREVAYWLSSNLAGEYVRLTETDDDRLIVAYGPLELGEILLASNRFIPNVRWTFALTPVP
jgi:transposase InsO family protein